MKAKLNSNSGESKIFIGPGGQMLQPVDSKAVKEDFTTTSLQTLLRCLENLAESNMILARTNLMLTAMILGRTQE